MMCYRKYYSAILIVFSPDFLEPTDNNLLKFLWLITRAYRAMSINEN